MYTNNMKKLEQERPSVRGVQVADTHGRGDKADCFCSWNSAAELLVWELVLTVEKFIELCRLWDCLILVSDIFIYLQVFLQ